MKHERPSALTVGRILPKTWSSHITLGFQETLKRLEELIETVHIWHSPRHCYIFPLVSKFSLSEHACSRSNTRCFVIIIPICRGLHLGRSPWSNTRWEEREEKKRKKRNPPQVLLRLFMWEVWLHKFSATSQDTLLECGHMSLSMFHRHSLTRTQLWGKADLIPTL